MDFAQTLTCVLVQLGWKVETQHDHGDNIARGISTPTYPPLKATIIASATDVSRTWDSWAEDKQTRGRDRLKTCISDVLRNIERIPGFTLVLHPEHWTPDS